MSDERCQGCSRPFGEHHAKECPFNRQGHKRVDHVQTQIKSVVADERIAPETVEAALKAREAFLRGEPGTFREAPTERNAMEAAIRAADDARRLSSEPLGVACPKCKATPGEPCYKKTGRVASDFHEERIARAAVNAGTFGIAYCPEHGLHGGREECWVCRRPVERIPMRPVGRPVERPS